MTELLIFGAGAIVATAIYFLYIRGKKKLINQIDMVEQILLREDTPLDECVSQAHEYCRNTKGIVAFGMIEVIESFRKRLKT